MNVTCFQYNIHRPSISISTPPSSVNSAPPQSISYLSDAVNPPLDLCQLLWLITCQCDCGKRTNGGVGGGKRRSARDTKFSRGNKSILELRRVFEMHRQLADLQQSRRCEEGEREREAVGLNCIMSFAQLESVTFGVLIRHTC